MAFVDRLGSPVRYGMPYSWMSSTQCPSTPTASIARVSHVIRISRLVILDVIIFFNIGRIQFKSDYIYTNTVIYSMFVY